MQSLIVVGDRTSHGGIVITGAPQADINGKPIARVGDRVTCPIKGHGTITIVATGDPTLIIDGAPVARHGDRTACGAMLLSSQVTTIDDPRRMAAESVQRTALAATAETDSGTGERSSRPEEADQHFLLLDEVTKQPLRNRLYRLHANGTTTEGRTDAEGRTQLILGRLGDEVTLEIFAENAES